MIMCKFVFRYIYIYIYICVCSIMLALGDTKCKFIPKSKTFRAFRVLHLLLPVNGD